MIDSERRDWAERWGLHPRSPDRYQGCSKRSWDGQIKKWRKLLHQWDTIPPVPLDPSQSKSPYRGSGSSPYVAGTPGRSPAPYYAKSPAHPHPTGAGGSAAAAATTAAKSNVSFRNVSEQPGIGPSFVPQPPSSGGKESESEEREREQAMQMAAMIADGTDPSTTHSVASVNSAASKAGAGGGGAGAKAAVMTVGGDDSDELVFHD